MFYEPRPPVHWSQALVTGTERRTEDSKTGEKTENLSTPRDAPPLADEATGPLLFSPVLLSLSGHEKLTSHGRRG